MDSILSISKHEMVIDIGDYEYLRDTHIDKSKSKYLSLYPEDFESPSIWEQICSVLDISSGTSEARIYFNKETIIPIRDESQEV